MRRKRAFVQSWIRPFSLLFLRTSFSLGMRSLLPCPLPTGPIYSPISFVPFPAAPTVMTHLYSSNSPPLPSHYVSLRAQRSQDNVLYRQPPRLICEFHPVSSLTTHPAPPGRNRLDYRVHSTLPPTPPSTSAPPRDAHPHFAIHSTARRH